jgi:hypothetical protein
MKHDHFFDASSFDFCRALLEFRDVRVANRAINETPELQMNKALRIGNVYGLPRHGFHQRRRQLISWFEFHGHFLASLSVLYHMLQNSNLEPSWSQA